MQQGRVKVEVYGILQIKERRNVTSKGETPPHSI
jgi:hypothetical protein